MTLLSLNFNDKYRSKSCFNDIIVNPLLVVSTHLDTSNDHLVADLYPHRLQRRADLHLIIALRLLSREGVTGCASFRTFWICAANTAVSLPGSNESGSGMQSVTQRVKFTISTVTQQSHYRAQTSLGPGCNLEHRVKFITKQKGSSLQ